MPHDINEKKDDAQKAVNDREKEYSGLMSFMRSERMDLFIQIAIAIPILLLAIAWVIKNFIK